MNEESLTSGQYSNTPAGLLKDNFCNQNNKSPDETIFERMPSLPQLRHWNEVVYECKNAQIDAWSIAGGSDYGQLPYLIESGDILLEVNGQKVSGLTRSDVISLLRKKPTSDIKAVSSSSSFGLQIDLREYLSRRFVRGSVDHDLQATIRDNVYMRTIPCTTRPPKPGEIDGVDYKFVSKEVFAEMEKSGVLLESGVYAGHSYGTPLPLSNPTIPSTPLVDNFDSRALDSNDVNYPYQSETIISSPLNSLANKRRRNRSNIAAIDASSLPQGWEKISDAQYGVYYIDHINKRTQYERPYEIELTKGANGFGFTLVEFDKGLIVVKNIVPGGPAYQSGVMQPGDVLVSVSGVSVSCLQHSDIAKLFATFSVGDRVKLTFARGYQLPFDLNNEDQEYEYLTVSLAKGVNGFGFTISDGNSGQKVKKILDIERCGLLRQGDILLNVNNIDLSPLKHMQVVEVLKQCPVGQNAAITVKRKKRFRIKTPITLQSSSFYYEKESNIPQRNCKTPNCEMIMRKDLDWMNNENNTYVNTFSDVKDVSPVNFDGTYNNVNHCERSPDGTYPTSHNYGNKEKICPPFASHNSPSYVNELNLSPRQHSSPITNKGENGINGTETNDDNYDYYVVSLVRGEEGFGFRIVGGAEENRNAAIGSIVIGGVAHRDGTLKAGDEIISINERNVIGASHHHVVELMSKCDRTVSLLVRRKKDSGAFDVVLNREINEGFGFVIISCSNCALIGRIIDGSPAQKCQRLRVRDKIISVNGQDITNMSHPDIVNMIKESGQILKLKIVPVDCYSVELMRGPKGFGFSIRGGAEYNGMPLFILKIAQDGSAHSLLNVGDGIIEINGISTCGMTHSEAVQLISESGAQVKLKLRRNLNPIIDGLNNSYDCHHQSSNEVYEYPYNSYSAPNLMQSQYRFPDDSGSNHISNNCYNLY